jgi:hypothetical protein
MKSEHKTTAKALVAILFTAAMIFAVRISFSIDTDRKLKKDLLASQSTREISPDPSEQDLGWWGVFDLSRNSPATQRTLVLILLIPFGVLVTAVCRDLVGLRTIGTFAPTLLAISQVKSNWKMGVVVFLLTFGVGSLARMLLLKYKLSPVPRRGIVAVFVVLSLAATITISPFFVL